MTEEPSEKNEKPKEEDDPEPVIPEEDCFEYKLVGVNVHSGTANAGHYWSYINTNRGGDENDPNWILSENDHWMEFNDSRVSDFQFKNLKEECFGDESSSTGNSWGFGNYGKSGYMLFYERRVKKPIKILVPEEKVESEKQKTEVHFDEEKKEHFKLVPFKECAADEAPNKIYQQVFDDNKNFTFENDVYSTEFESFVKQCLQNAADLEKTEGADAEAVREARR